jgi:hypothetical protein
MILRNQPGWTSGSCRRLVFLIFVWLLSFSSPAMASDVIPGAQFPSAELVKGIPTGWVLEKRAGTPNLCLEKEGDGYVLRLASDRNSSYGIKRALHVDLKQYPFLSWRWKAVRLPQGGDVRESQTDDQALQFYVAFPSLGFPAKLNTPVVGYIWDNEAPRGWTGRSDQFGGGKLRYVVVRNKTDRLGEWHNEKRNLYEDYKRLFGDLRGAGSITQGIAFYINSQNTKSEAEGWIGDVLFSRN